MEDELEILIQFLQVHHSRTQEHSGEKFIAHLRGTRQLLVQWGARPALCAAALFHSVCGPDACPDSTVPASLRDEVRQLIGAEAEQIARLFCVMERSTLVDNVNRTGEFRVKNRHTNEPVPLNATEVSDLSHLLIANVLEVLRAVPPKHRATVWPMAYAGLLPFRPVVLRAAQSAIDALVLCTAHPIGGQIGRSFEADSRHANRLR
jgi:Domain of unknown function (DUF6817)